MTLDDRGLPTINSYIDLIDRFLRRSVSAPDFQLTYLRMLKNERRILGGPVFPVLQELFEDADRYVAEPRLRRGTEDLDDEGLVSWAASVRLRLAQTRPVTTRLGLSSQQRRQLALLLGNKHTDHLAAHLRHSDPLPISNAFQPDEHGCRHMELHRVLPTRSVLRRRPRTHDHRIFDAECAHVSSPDPLNTATTTVFGWLPNFLVTEQPHSTRLDRP